MGFSGLNESPSSYHGQGETTCFEAGFYHHSCMYRSDFNQIPYESRNNIKNEHKKMEKHLFMGLLRSQLINLNIVLKGSAHTNITENYHDQ